MLSPTTPHLIKTRKGETTEGKVLWEASVWIMRRQNNIETGAPTGMPAWVPYGDSVFNESKEQAIVTIKQMYLSEHNPADYAWAPYDTYETVEDILEALRSNQTPSDA